MNGGMITYVLCKARISKRLYDVCTCALIVVVLAILISIIKTMIDAEQGKEYKRKTSVSIILL